MNLFQTHFPPAEFAARRASVFDALGGAAAVVQGGPEVRGFEVFRQTNEFYYLCGVEVPHSYLLLDGRDRRTMLFLPERDPSQSASEGESLADRDETTVCATTGVDSVCRVGALLTHLKDARTLYVPHSPAEGRAMCRDTLRHANRTAAADPWDSSTSREGRFLDLLRTRVPGAEICDLSPALDALRVLKSPAEVALIRRASELCGRAVLAAMRATKPGVWEYQLGALASYQYESSGAQGEGYRAIIAGGENAWNAHYFRNGCVLNDGDLVLMDHAPDCGYYTSDIGRMWPVNGTYSPLQCELYGFVVEYQKALLKRIRPGAMAAQVHAEAAEEMTAVVERWSFSKPLYEAAARRMLEFQGPLSHSVGMAVHDVGDYKPGPLEPGMVFAIDPQMWVPEEKLYLRCEDTVVVTGDGSENLTGFVPVELDAVEAVMREDGMLQAR